MSGLPTPQGKSSATWRCPPLDGSLTVPEIFEYHAKNSPAHPVFVYPDNRTGSRSILCPEAHHAFRKAARIASGHYKAFKEKHGPATPSAMGILAVADSISYFSLMAGIMQLGLTVFPISTRNSAVGIAHLLRATGVQQVFVSPDSAMQRLSQDAVGLLAEGGISVELLPFPQFGDLYDGSDVPDIVPLGELSNSKDTTALILHSSGSTAFPKPIKVSHLNFLQWGRALYYGEVDVCGRVVAAHALPMFHGMGATVMTWVACSGAVMGCFAPSSPPVLPNPDNFLEAIVATQSDLVSCVPAHIEAWSRSPANLPFLQKLTGIVFGGAPLNKQIGDALSRAGVKLTPFYGATEIGNVILSVPDLEHETEWEYFRFSPHLCVEFVLQEDTADIFEPIILSSPPYAPNVINTEMNGVPGYGTNDLVQRHPVRGDHYRIYGRLDDQLMLSTGEKTNPVPLEAIMLQDPHIVAALVFGRGRFQNGVIIQPKEEFDPDDTENLAGFRNAIWPTIEQVNEYAPSHSRIFKEMIIVTNPAKPFEYTPKGTPRRHVCIDAYSAEIDAAYAAVKTSSQTELQPPPSWTPELVLEFVRAAVGHVVKRRLQDEDDLFQHGCDSLQATWIRNTILRALRSSPHVSTRGISSTFVYTHPSIFALSGFISGLFSTTGASQGSAATPHSKAQEMRALVQKYSQNFAQPSVRESAEQPDGQTVLLTGSTGRLGCHLLAVLLRRPDVLKVFALNRGLSHAGLDERQRGAFAMWGLDAGLLSSPKLTLLVSDLAKERLSLEREVYEQIRRSVTIVIHNAWRVDFNLSLSSFEPLIAGVRNLVDLALCSTCPGGARFVFTSSVAVLRNHGVAHPAPEEPIANPETSIGMGYSESKWVAEQVLVAAAKSTCLRSTIIRVGQLSGDTQIGGWNMKEWLPALMAASKILNCIPQRDELVNWVPVDIAASVLVEMATGPYEPVLHLLCPRSIPWDTLLKPIAEGLNLPLVPYSEWLSQLQTLIDSSHTDASESPRHSATLSLREFFQNGYFGDSVPLDTVRAVRVSGTLAGLQAPDEESVWRSIRLWRKAGLFGPSDQ